MPTRPSSAQIAVLRARRPDRHRQDAQAARRHLRVGLGRALGARDWPAGQHASSAPLT